MRFHALLATVVLAGCARAEPASSSSELPAKSVAEPPAPPVPERARRDRLVLVAGGDVDLGRDLGKRVLREPAYDPFRELSPLLASADVRFANLESQLSDQRGETISPNNPLVFTGPPFGADVLRRAGFDVVSTANNHAWDYGLPALRETLDNLDRVGIAHAGTSREAGGAARPAIVEKEGFRVAFVAFTAVWNQGPLASHAARDYVSAASVEAIRRAVDEARTEQHADAVVVSVHAGEEYQDRPLASHRALLESAIDAGADVVLGHHPHVVEGIELHRGKPIVYSLGNLAMRMHRDHRWTEIGSLVRVTFARDASPALAVCPFRILGSEPIPVGARPNERPVARVALDHLASISLGLGPAWRFGELDASGCAQVVADDGHPADDHPG